jgi:heptosyltransferase-2
MGQPFQKILIVKNRAMGDAVMGLSTVQYLKKIYPKAIIAYGIPAWTEPLFSKVKTAADLIIPLNFSSAKNIWQSYRKIKAFSPDYIHELHATGTGINFFNFYQFIHHAKYTFHNHHLKEKTQVYDQGVIKPLIQRDLDGINSFIESESIPNHLDYIPQMNIQVKKQNKIIFGCVATRETKKWPLKFYLDLAKLIYEQDSNTQIVIPLSNSSDDLKTEREILNNQISTNISIVKLELEELPLELASAKLYIGNDTGLKHICVALNVSTYTLFGPEPPLEWHPYSKNNHDYYYREPLECRTRTHHYCGLNHCDSMICLNEFKASDLFLRLLPKYLG